MTTPKEKLESDIIEETLDRLSIRRCYELAEMKIREEISKQYEENSNVIILNKDYLKLKQKFIEENK